MRTSIRSKLIAAILLPLLAVYLGVLAINYSTGKRQAQVQAEQHLQELASNHATRLDGRFRAAEQAAAAVAILIADRQPLTPPRQSSTYLARRVSGDPLLFGACVAFEPGAAGNANHAGQYIYRVEAPPTPAGGARGPRRPGQPTSRPAAKGIGARFRKPPFRRGDLAKDHPTFYQEDWYARAMAGQTPRDVLTQSNRIIASDNDRAMFVTLFFAHYNTRTGELVYANAGHNPPCIAAPDSTVHRLAESTGPILGVFEDQQYTQRTAQLDPGASLVLYTDGVTEALDARDRQFSLDRFERIIAQNPTASPEEITHLVVQTVEQYRTHAQQDDVTLMALRRN